jgi:hypothetical protein
MPMNKPVKPKVMAKPKPRSKVAPVKPKAKVTKPRGSTTQTQVGNDNQRERYNQDREKNTRLQLSNRAFGNSSKATAAEKKAYGKDMGRPSASGSGGKVTTAEVKKKRQNLKGLKKGYGSETMSAYNSQRAGGKVGSKNAGKSNPMPRKRFKAPKGA